MLDQPVIDAYSQIVWIFWLKVIPYFVCAMICYFYFSSIWNRGVNAFASAKTFSSRDLYVYWSFNLLPMLVPLSLVLYEGYRLLSQAMWATFNLRAFIWSSLAESLDKGRLVAVIEKNDVGNVATVPLANLVVSLLFVIGVWAILSRVRQKVKSVYLYRYNRDTKQARGGTARELAIRTAPPDQLDNLRFLETTVLLGSVLVLGHSFIELLFALLYPKMYLITKAL